MPANETITSDRVEDLLFIEHLSDVNADEIDFQKVKQAQLHDPAIRRLFKDPSAEVLKTEEKGYEV